MQNFLTQKNKLIKYNHSISYKLYNLYSDLKEAFN